MNIQSQVEQAIIHVATLKLKKIIRQALPLPIYISVQDRVQYLLAKVFCLDNRQNAIPAISLLHKNQMKKILSERPQLQRQQLNRLCRQYTKLFIKNLIRKQLCQNTEFQLRIGQSKIEQGKNKQIQYQKIKRTKNNETILRIIRVVNVKIQNMNVETEVDRLSALSATPKPSLQQTSCKTQCVSDRVNIKAEPFASNVLTHFNDNAAHLAYQKNKSCQFLQETQRYGHFLYGDELQQIIQVVLVQNQMFGRISWKARSNGVIPESSQLSVTSIRKFVPLQLAQFYDRFIEKMRKRKKYLNSY